MTHRHSSFLLRCWDLGSESERIEIEHIQSGAKSLAKSVGAAVEWICGHGGADTAISTAVIDAFPTGSGSTREATR